MMPLPPTEIVPELLTDPWIVLGIVPPELVKVMPAGPPGPMVPALTTLPLTVAPLNVTQAIVFATGLVKLATAPGPTTFAHAAMAGRVPPPTSNAATDDDASKQSVPERSSLRRTRLPPDPGDADASDAMPPKPIKLHACFPVSGAGVSARIMHHRRRQARHVPQRHQENPDNFGDRCKNASQKRAISQVGGGEITSCSARCRFRHKSANLSRTRRRISPLPSSWWKDAVRRRLWSAPRSSAAQRR